MFKKSALLALLSAATLNFAFADSIPVHNNPEANSKTATEEHTVVSALNVSKEIFLKGSIDGKRLCFIMGLEDGTSLFNEAMGAAISTDQLIRLGSDFYNQEHQSDILAALGESKKAVQELAPEILKMPWNTIKNIPHSFEVNLEAADDSYYHAIHPMVGSVKYAGWATWAVIEGSLKLIVEVPVEASVMTALTAGWTAYPPISQALKISWDTTCVIARFVAMPTLAVVGGTYSLTTATLAAAGSLVYGGGVAVYNGVKWVAYDVPRYFSYPVRVDVLTQMSVDNQADAARAVQTNLEKNEFLKITSKIGKYQSKFTVQFEDGTKFGTVWIFAKNGKLIVRGEITRSYLKTVVAAQNLPYAEAKKDLENSLRSDMVRMVSEVIQSIPNLK